ncbi:protein kinase [Gemmatimonas sp.]|uniref:protein kinase domain-containing protein n=1 Tax=Gemmatimonas sp. TaxID=1962908 RepID=UPI0033427662
MSDSTLYRLTTALEGRYRVDRELGAGGMATVYLAHDLKHEREVAIKVLHPDLGAALGGERFLAEIKTTAKLQHPHILPLLDSGAADGLLYYVMPYVRGETLRARLERESQLPLADALLIAREVADALAEAHGQGIVHRDIKPENILLQGGHALVADFGIALAVQQAGGARMTQTGLSLGTPQYMAPEQAMGDKAVDHRADQYALAAVTYEMLTSEPPHTGTNPQAIVAKLLTEAVRPATVLRPSVPAHVDAALRRGLEKLPADRFTSAKAFADALGDASTTTTVSGVPIATRRAWYTQPLPYAAALVLSLVALGWQAMRGTATTPLSQAPVRFVVKPPADGLGAGRDFTVAVSGDGRRIAFMARSGSVRRIHVQDLNSLVAKSLPGTETARFFALSPDGKELIMQLAAGGARRVVIESGTITDIVLPEGRGKLLPGGVAWAGNTTVLSFGRVGDIALLRAGEPAKRVSFTKDGKPYSIDGIAALSADGEWLVFPGPSIAVAPVDGGEVKELGLPADGIVGALSDILIYQDVNFQLMGVPIDWATRTVGSPKPLESGISAGSHASLSPSGTLTMLTGSSKWSLEIVDERGNGVPIGEPVDQSLSFPRLSPDGKRIAVSASVREGTSLNVGINIVDIASGTSTRLTSGMYADRPEWTPDGKRVLFRRLYAERREEIWWQPYDRSATAEPLQTYTGDGARFMAEGLISPNGEYLLYRILAGVSGRDIWYRALTGDTNSKVFEATPADEVMPRFSPDGRWVAYTSNESGIDQVFVRPFPGPGGRTQVSPNAGSEPVWAPDGRRLFYINGSDLMAASVNSINGFAVTAHERLFTSDITPGWIHANYDAMKDGRHFLMIRNPGGTGDLTVVLNWLDEARKRMTPP